MTVLLHASSADQVLADDAQRWNANGYISKSRGLIYFQQHIDWWLVMPEVNIAAVTEMDDQSLDMQPFGVIRLDRTGIVRSYNTYEQDLGEEEPGSGDREELLHGRRALHRGAGVLRALPQGNRAGGS